MSFQLFSDDLVTLENGGINIEKMFLASFIIEKQITKFIIDILQNTS